MSIEIFVILALIPLACGFSMNTPEYYSTITYLWVIGLSLVGSLIARFQYWKENKRKKISLMEIIGELFISGFAGIITFFLCEFLEVPQLLTMFLCGIAGNMGSKSLDFFGLLFMRFFEKKLDFKINNDKEYKSDDSSYDDNNDYYENDDDDYEKYNHHKTHRKL